MPLFSVRASELSAVDQTNFLAEKDLQSLIEKNLQIVFGCRFVASEFQTGVQHAGRIDTLALSEDNNPVIIEYKKIESSDLINQSLFYLSWLRDHHGDFEITVQKQLNGQVEVDWSGVRVICLAPNYKKYDLHAVQVMGANIELWTYRLFKNNSLYLEEVFQKSVTTSVKGKAQEAGHGTVLSKEKSSYTVEQHFNGKPDSVQALARSIQEFVLGLDPSMEEVPKKFYIAYKISQNIVCMEVQRQKVLVFVKLDPKEVDLEIARNVTNIGHYGTGDLELTIKTSKDLDVAKPWIEQGYQKVGG